MNYTVKENVIDVTFPEEQVEKAYESHEQFLTRRSGQMAGMIGMLSSRLEIVALHHRLDMEFGPMTVDMWRRSVKQMRMEILETLIRYQHEWSEMQQYETGDVGLGMYERKIAEYTTELEALKTLAL
jgi:hypothetical protein